MKLVENPGKVLVRASSLWAAYGALILDVGIKVLEYVRDNREMRLQDMVVPILLLLIPVFRVVQQQSLQPPALAPLKE
jgi:hypothetical protein